MCGFFRSILFSYSRRTLNAENIKIKISSSRANVSSLINHLEKISPPIEDSITQQEIKINPLKGQVQVDNNFDTLEGTTKHVSIERRRTYSNLDDTSLDLIRQYEDFKESVSSYWSLYSKGSNVVSDRDIETAHNLGALGRLKYQQYIHVVCVR